MSLTSASVDLGNAFNTAEDAWLDARATWTDSVAEHFESEQWRPLENHVRSVQQAMDRLAPVLARAIRECS